MRPHAAHLLLALLRRDLNVFAGIPGRLLERPEGASIVVSVLDALPAADEAHFISAILRRDPASLPSLADHVSYCKRLSLPRRVALFLALLDRGGAGLRARLLTGLGSSVQGDDGRPSKAMVRRVVAHLCAIAAAADEDRNDDSTVWFEPILAAVARWDGAGLIEVAVARVQFLGARRSWAGEESALLARETVTALGDAYQKAPDETASAAARWLNGTFRNHGREDYALHDLLRQTLTGVGFVRKACDWARAPALRPLAIAALRAKGPSPEFEQIGRCLLRAGLSEHEERALLGAAVGIAGVVRGPLSRQYAAQAEFFAAWEEDEEAEVRRFGERARRVLMERTAAERRSEEREEDG